MERIGSTMTKTSMIAVVDACYYHFWMLPRDIARRVNEEMLPWFILLMIAG